MINIDLDYFCEKHLRRNENIITSIECLNQGNPFPGILILTDQQLAFIRKNSPGAQKECIKLQHISAMETRIANGMDFILVIKNEKFDHEFHIRAMDIAKKKEFVQLLQSHLDKNDPGNLALIAS